MSTRIQAALEKRNGGNQSELARYVGVSPQAVQKWIAGVSEPKGKNLRLAAEFLEMSESELRFGYDESKIIRMHGDIDLSADDKMVSISSAAGSMGLGFPQIENEQTIGGMRISRAWVQGHLPKITGVEKLAILTAYGDSMSPTFNDGDLLLVDRGVNSIELDAVYVISRNNELFVKRVRRRFQDGAVIVKSDNPLFGPDDVITNGEREELNVLGRVVWAWSGKRL